MKNGPDKVVFDCNVFAQSIISKRGPAHACLDLARSGEIWLVWSEYIIQEITELPWKLPARLNITKQQVLVFIRRVAEYAEMIEEIPEVYKLLEDEDDSPYINLALAAGAKLITSRDRHLLWLMDPSKPEGQEFRRRFPDLVILKPEQLLQRLREEMASG